MPPFDSPADHPFDPSQDQRVAELEARVGWLETAMAQLLGEPPSRHPPVSILSGPALDPFHAACPAAGSGQGTPWNHSQPTTRVRATYSPAQLEQREQHLESMATLLDNMGITAAFANLKARAMLEDQHPAVLERITASWRTPEARRYLHRLLIDDLGDQHGFESDVIGELLLLSAMLDDASLDAARPSDSRSPQ